MKIKSIYQILIVSLGIFLASCVVVPAHYNHVADPVYEGPPAGYSDYEYYPSANVYFDPGLNFYFYLSGTRWIRTRHLPSHYHLRHSERVHLRMKGGHPYRYHNEHRRGHYRHRYNRHDKRDARHGGRHDNRSDRTDRRHDNRSDRTDRRHGRKSDRTDRRHGRKDAHKNKQAKKHKKKGGKKDKKNGKKKDKKKDKKKNGR